MDIQKRRGSCRKRPWGPPAGDSGRQTATSAIRSSRKAGWSCFQIDAIAVWRHLLVVPPIARRAPFAAPRALDDLNSDDYDSDSTLSADLGIVMFSSTRSGNAEIYEAAALR